MMKKKPNIEVFLFLFSEFDMDHYFCSLFSFLWFACLSFSGKEESRLRPLPLYSLLS